MMCTYISCTAYFSVRAILILYHIKFLHGKHLRCLRMCVHGLEHQEAIQAYMRQLLWIICVGSGSGLLSFNQCLMTLFQIFPSSFVTYVSEVLCFKISISVFVFYKLLNFFTYKHLH